MVSQAELILRVVSLWISGLVSILLETVWVPLTSHDHYRLRAQYWFYFSSLIMDICDRPSKHAEVE